MIVFSSVVFIRKDKQSIEKSRIENIAGFYCQLWTYFTPSSSVCLVDIKQVVMDFTVLPKKKHLTTLQRIL